MGKQQSTRFKKTTWKYVISFIFMLLLTAVAFMTVMTKMIETPAVKILILTLAVIQIILQIFIFMHLNSKQQWFRILLMFGGAFIGVVTVIFLMLLK